MSVKDNASDLSDFQQCKKSLPAASAIDVFSFKNAVVQHLESQSL